MYLLGICAKYIFCILYLTNICTCTLYTLCSVDSIESKLFVFVMCCINGILYFLKYLLVHARRGDISLASGRFAHGIIRSKSVPGKPRAFLATNSSWQQFEENGTEALGSQLIFMQPSCISFAGQMDFRAQYSVTTSSQEMHFLHTVG